MYWSIKSVFIIALLLLLLVVILLVENNSEPAESQTGWFRVCTLETFPSYHWGWNIMLANKKLDINPMAGFTGDCLQSFGIWNVFADNDDVTHSCTYH